MVLRIWLNLWILFLRKKCTHIQIYIILLSSQSERVHIFPEAHLWMSLTNSGSQIKSTSSKIWEPNIERCIRSEKIGYITYHLQMKQKCKTCKHFKTINVIVPSQEQNKNIYNERSCHKTMSFLLCKNKRICLKIFFQNVKTVTLGCYHLFSIFLAKQMLWKNICRPSLYSEG